MLNCESAWEIEFMGDRSLKEREIILSETGMRGEIVKICKEC
jgi:hypothetical protein